jgi:outer membrane protein assembly factor BamB
MVLQLLAVLMLIFAAGPGFAEDKATQEAFMKALNEALKKADENLEKEMQKPEFWEKMFAVAVRMPEVEEKPVTRQVLVGKHFIRDMRFIAADRLLINYNSDNPILVDTAKGAILWKFVPEGWLLSYYYIVAAFSDLILIREDEDKKTTLAAIDATNGKQLWYATFKSKKKSFQFLPVPGAGIVLIAELEKKKVTLSGLDLFTGKERWQQKFKIGKFGHPVPPVITSWEMWNFYGGVRRIDAGTGKALWKRTDIVLGNRSPPPVLQGGILNVIDNKKTLHVLDSETGETRFNKALDQNFRYTNIHPKKDRLYVRGERIGGPAAKKYVLIAMDGKGRKPLWTHTGTEPTVSNLIEEDGRLYIATPSTVLCLDRGTGQQIFASAASQTGQTFPVRLRKFRKRIIYVGELVIAGFDASTGKRLYREGMTPVSQEAHLDALDNWISVLETRIGKLTKAMWFGGSGGASSAFSRQAEISQNLSNKYSSQASYYRGRANSSYNMSASSDYWKSARLRSKAQIEAASARANARLGFFFAMQDLTNSMLSGSVAKDRAEIKKLQRIRQSITLAYAAAEAGEYVYRPHVENNSVGVLLVHMPTGRSTFTSLTPMTSGKNAYWNDRGIWNLIDLKNATIYHHGLRILPKKFQDKNPKDKNIKAYGMYLIVEPVTIPRR